MILVTVLVVALAAHRLARGVAVDTITDRFRDAVYRRAFQTVTPVPFPAGAADEDDARLEGWVPPEVTRVRSRAWSTVYGLLSCPHCCGWWLSLALWALWSNYDRTHVYVMAVAVAGAQSVLSAKGMD